MRRIIKISPLLVMLSILFYSCENFIEEDITNQRISLISPANKLITDQVNHTFGWDELEDAEQYKLEIVEGTFNAVNSFVLDTIVGSNRFSAILYPGDFEWRVRGENNGSETDYTTFSLFIDSTLDISSLPIALFRPSLNFITNNDSIDFEWQDLDNADVYNIQIHQDVWGTNPVTDISLITPSYAERLPEGTYVWAVRATNNITFTSTSFVNPPRTIIIDTTAPSLPVLISPGDNDIITSDSNLTYQWNQGASIGSGTPTIVTDIIYFYSDSLGTLIDSIPIPSGITSHLDSIDVTHFWAVRSVDAAKNIGSFSPLRKVNVTP